MRILKASPGCVYTDGEAYGETVCLADGADQASWREISKEMAEKLQAEAAAKAEAEAREATEATTDKGEEEAKG